SSAKRFTGSSRVMNYIRNILNRKGALLTSRTRLGSLAMEPEARDAIGMKRDNLDRLRRVFEPALRRAMHIYWRSARGMTRGVRALVLDEEGRVFLVKHSYVSGWHLPGGGVEAGETLVEAVARELHEEGNIDVTEPPRLHGMFFNDRDSRRDHVALFV